MTRRCSIRQGALGCCRRYHQPPESDPVYDQVVEKVNLRDKVLSDCPTLDTDG